MDFGVAARGFGGIVGGSLQGSSMHPIESEMAMLFNHVKTFGTDSYGSIKQNNRHFASMNHLDDLESAAYCLLVCAQVTLSRRVNKLPWNDFELEEVVQMKRDLLGGRVS